MAVAILDIDGTLVDTNKSCATQVPSPCSSLSPGGRGDWAGIS
jgi:phosphoglycolate phosphatase-like HAD superfamily hydrolase